MRRLISGAAALLALSLTAAAVPAEASSAHPPANRATTGRTVTFDGWGGLRLGMTAKQAQATGMVSHERGHCAPGYEMSAPYRDRGFVVWNGQRRYTVGLVTVIGAADRTAAGAHVGSTLGQLRHLYRGLTKPVGGTKIDEGAGTSGGKDLWVASVKRKRGTLNFQFAYGKRPTAGSKVEMILVAPEQTVYWGC
jgi:hypothetical protein